MCFPFIEVSENIKCDGLIPLIRARNILHGQDLAVFLFIT